MNKLEKLYKVRKELDEVLKEVELEQSKIEAEIIEKKDIRWNKMFEDLYSLKKYSSFIDTGIRLYKGQTLGFEIRNDYICVISWEHFDCNGKQIEPKTKTYFFTIKKDTPFETDSIYSNWMKYITFAIENWNKVMNDIEIRLVQQMEVEIKKRIAHSKQKQIELEKQLKIIS